MFQNPQGNPYPFFQNMPTNQGMCAGGGCPLPPYTQAPFYQPELPNQAPSYYQPAMQPQNMPASAMPSTRMQDYGPQELVVNLKEVAMQNPYYRQALWTGQHLQVTLMNIAANDEIGIEIHPNHDQLITVEDGQAVVMMGKQKERLDFQTHVWEGYAIIIPAGIWHNVINTANKALKLCSVYAPPHHPFGTVQETKAIAMKEQY